MPLAIAPLTPSFGARVSGFSIRDGVDAATVAEIAAAFEEYSVLLFPDQPVTDEEQIAFSQRFGPLEATLAGSLTAGQLVARMSNYTPEGTLKEPDGQSALFTRANMLWHTDSSFKDVPARASLLSARILSRQGGDTEFASTRAAYAALPQAMKDRLEGLIAIHDIAHSRRQLSDKAITAEQRAAMPPVPQALVRANPVNGRKALLLGSHVSGILGLPDAEATALHDELLAFATRPAFTYRHHWTPDDMIMWDNRAVLHRVHAYDEITDKRLMVRTTVAGAGPTVIDGVIQAEA